MSLVDYRRVLCDDFGIDMDLVNTMKNDGMMNISASLSHFHAVLCAFDILMLSQVSIDMDDSGVLVPKTIDEGDGDEAVSTVLTDDGTTAVSRKTEIIVNMILEDASVTFVREIGEYFTPVARIYTFYTMCEIRVEIPTKVPLGSEAALGGMPSSVIEIALHFSEESDSELRDDEGMSIWGFNSVLGSWEPIMEPWTSALGVQLVDDHKGKVTTSIDLRGSDVHSLSLNFSPSLLDSFCAIAKEMEQLFSDPPKTRCWQVHLFGTPPKQKYVCSIPTPVKLKQVLISKCNFFKQFCKSSGDVGTFRCVLGVRVSNTHCVIVEDGKSIVEIGTIEAHDACGIPITLVKMISSVRVVVKPHNPAVIAGATNTTVSNTSTDVKDHRWSNELFISDREECTEHFASCSRILDDYDCKCQRMFDGSQPLHVGQVCKANGSFFRVWSRVFTASNASSLRYSQMRVLPPLSFENKCGVALFVVVFFVVLGLKIASIFILLHPTRSHLMGICNS
uniref:Uncharacterized protein n=1 Tax=Globisporangium ultimum (strain ATCC 200006 / CBS 805.95 / DAOM BR144) TaxID=431595 RepID=K3W5D8_GLOUD